MAAVVWVMMGIAVWHFTVFVPDRFWGGIVGAFVAAAIGAVLFGFLVNGATVPGPIGSVLTPGLDLHRYATLPFASTLCGSCAAVCPVKIPLDDMLYRWRQVATDAGAVPWWKRALLRVAGRGLGRPGLHRVGGRLTQTFLARLPPALVRAWGHDRELPEVPVETFRTWARRNRPAPP